MNSDNIQKAYQDAKQRIDFLLWSNATPEKQFIEVLKAQLDRVFRLLDCAAKESYSGIQDYFEFLLSAKLMQSLFLKSILDGWPKTAGIEFKSCPSVWRSSLGNDTLNSAMEWAGAVVDTAESCLFRHNGKNIFGRLIKRLTVEPKEFDDWRKGTVSELQKEFNLTSSDRFIVDCKRLWDTLESEAQIYFAKPQESGGEKTKRQNYKEPTKEARTAYRLYTSMGITQEEIAKMMTKELKKKITQSKVSRWVKDYKKHLELHGLPIETPQGKPKIVVNSENLDLGARTDGRRGIAPKK